MNGAYKTLGIDPFSYSQNSLDSYHQAQHFFNTSVMELKLSSRAIIVAITFISVASLSIFLESAVATVQAGSHTALGNDETEFVFAGTCHNGEAYRLFSYNKVVDGQTYPHYDYEGPAGKGSVSTRATPRTMAVRVCIKLAEIIDDH